MRLGHPDMLDSPWRNGMSGVAWRIARDSTGRERGSSRRSSETRERDVSEGRVPSPGSVSDTDSEERRSGRSRSRGREDWRDEWQNRRRDAYSPNLGRQMSRESVRVHRAAVNARFSLWGIMMIMVVWMALLQHTFRYATITLLHAYSSVLPMEFRALDWATRGRTFGRRRGRPGFEGRAGSPAWQAVEAGAERAGAAEFRVMAIPAGDAKAEGEWEERGVVPLRLGGEDSGDAGMGLAVPMTVRIVGGGRGGGGRSGVEDPVVVLGSGTKSREGTGTLRPFGWLGDGWEEGGGEAGEKGAGEEKGEGEREERRERGKGAPASAVRSRQAKLLAELDRLLQGEGSAQQQAGREGGGGAAGEGEGKRRRRRLVLDDAIARIAGGPGGEARERDGNLKPGPRPEAVSQGAA